MKLSRLLPLGLVALLAALSACGTSSSTCSADTCSGCCNASGQCVGGTDVSACGNQGATCAVCSSAQVCGSSGCEGPLLSDAGQDAGTTADAGTGTDAGTDAGVVVVDAGAIVAPANAWTWVDEPETMCGNGVATGLGINPSSTSKDVIIYLQGGGACWNALTCFLVGSAAHLSDGYTASTFAADGTSGAPAFNRANSSNPFKDLSFVMIPYCTGDVHAGASTQAYDNTHPAVQHHGAANMDAALARLKKTFPDAAHVYLTGSSAGAFGAQLNYERVVAAFPSAEVHVFADSGQMINPAGTLLSTWLSAWNFNIPADCTGCTTDFPKFPKYLAGKYPTRRFALTAYTQDNTLKTFFNYSPADFQTQTQSLLTASYDTTSNAKYYLLAGTSHTMLGDLFTITSPSNVTLLTFVNQWMTGDAAWASVHP